MAWGLFAVPSGRRGDLDGALKDDVLSRQSQTIRDAKTLGGPAETLYVLIEGSPEAVRRADELLQGIGTHPPTAEAERVVAQLREEAEAASAGMGLFFTEG